MSLFPIDLFCSVRKTPHLEETHPSHQHSRKAIKAEMCCRRQRRLADCKVSLENMCDLSVIDGDIKYQIPRSQQSQGVKGVKGDTDSPFAACISKGVFSILWHLEWLKEEHPTGKCHYNHLAKQSSSASKYFRRQTSLTSQSVSHEFCRRKEWLSLKSTSGFKWFSSIKHIRMQKAFPS